MFMSSKLQILIENAKELKLVEQLELINAISRHLQLNYQQTDFTDDFWKPQTLEQILQAQQTQAVQNIKDLKSDFWLQEESVDEFIEYIYRQRHEDNLADDCNLIVI